MYLVKYTMLKYIKEWIKDFDAVQKEFREMGYFTYTSMYGSFLYFDKEMYDEYMKKKEKENNDT